MDNYKVVGLDDYSRSAFLISVKAVRNQRMKVEVVKEMRSVVYFRADESGVERLRQAFGQIKNI